MDSTNSTDLPSLRLYLFGAFRLAQAGRALALPTRKIASLLAYLALHPEPHVREKIATLFWGDSSDEHARRSLRTALAALRKQVGDNLLLADRETVQLNPALLLWVDVREFQIADFKQQSGALALQIGEAAQSTIHNLQSAIALYQGDLLDGFDDEWIASERERYRAHYLDALLQLTQQFRTQGEYPRAIETARQVLATDVANEHAHQQLMWCYLALGDHESALKQYAECQRVLRAELAVEPSPETKGLYQRIKQTMARRPSVETAHTNLPIPLTSFIGRTRELAMVKHLLDPSGTLRENPKDLPARLLTLTGVGGCGKTRLAIQVARSDDLSRYYADGVWWVELTAVSDASLVPHMVRKVLGIGETLNIEVLDLLVNHLRDKSLLLVLDNCEHLVTVCAQLAETILSHCPAVQILATSREALGIGGEVAWLVPSLSLPIEDVIPSPEALLQWEGIRLFVERARTMRADFAIMPTNANAVAQVCRQLDGMPLAIELAAARTKTLSVEQIAARLDDRFHLLTLGSRMALPRQQTLRATIDWSYELLSDAERVLSRRLSVFAGGWTLEAAETVCGDNVGAIQSPSSGDESPLQPMDILDLLTQLVNKSLVLTEERDGETRYRMLETIRQYGREKLEAAGEGEQVQARHLNACLQFAEAVEPKLYGPEQVQWLKRVESDHDNLRAALGWALAQGESAAMLRLSGALGRFWRLRGYWNEGREWLQQALASSRCAADMSEMSSDYRSGYAKASHAAGALASLQGDPAAAQAFFEESLALFRELGDKRGIASSLIQLGVVARIQGDDAAARALLEEGLALSCEVGDKGEMAWSLGSLGGVAFDQGDYALAQARFEESLALSRELRDQKGIAMILNNLVVHQL
jgi:non-specific serine/threonine protein kinase